MSEIMNIVGQRIRNYRTEQGLSQEKLAEMSGCHPTYIGQIERGEKNATIESIAKISLAMKLPLSRLFEKVDESTNPADNIPLMCYELIDSKSKSEQERIYKILLEINKYKSE